MENTRQIEEIRAWFKQTVEDYGWRMAPTSRLTSSYSVSGFKKALAVGTLKYDAIIEIITAKGLLEEFREHFPEATIPIQKKTQNDTIEDLIAQKVSAVTTPQLQEIKELLYRVLFAVQKEDVGDMLKDELQSIKKENKDI